MPSLYPPKSKSYVHFVHPLEDANQYSNLIGSLTLSAASAKTTSSLIPLSHRSFDVIEGMDWLSKRKFVMVCYEKVVRIPLEGDEILRVHGERTLRAAKALMNVKVDELKLSDISVVRDFIDVLPEDLSMTTAMTRICRDIDREVKSLKHSRILLVKVHWNSKQGPEFTWEREDYMKSKYPQLFIDRAVESAS
ncbi:hypothetical protein Tco_1226593 [Tanacetum coccineum]